MPNIRIKDIPSTASATSSTDFIGIDGSANGTRKLNAFSPTFGGNLTASGTGTFGGVLNAGGSTVSPTGATTSINLNTTTANWEVGRNDTAGGFYIYGYGGAGYALKLADATGNATLGGNLTVNGTGTHTFAGKIKTTSSSGIEVLVQSGNTGLAIQSGTTQYSLYLNAADNSFRIYTSLGGDRVTLSGGGNLLLGTTTDSGNGKLQLATHTTSAGGIGFGTQMSLYLTAPNDISLDALFGGPIFRFRNQGVEKFRLEENSSLTYFTAANSIIMRPGGITALTLDSSQNATFAGFATVSKKTTTATQSSFVLGDDLAITTNSGRSKMTLGSTNSVSEILLGQTSSNCLVLQWEYAANVANARGLIGTYGYSNPIAILASSVTIGTGPSATTALTLTSAQQVQANATTDSTSTTTGALTVAGGVGIAKKLYASGVYAKPTSGWATLEAQAPAADTSAAIDFVPSGTLSSSNPVWFAGHRYSAHGPLSFWVYNGTSHENTVFSLANTGNLTIGGSLTTAAPTSGTAKAWKLGEVATVSPTSPNRTIRVEIDGTVYYISAKTTND